MTRKTGHLFRFGVGIVLAGISVLLWSLGSTERSPTATGDESFEAGAWVFDKVWSLPLEYAHGLASGDVDGDGHAEVLVCHSSSVEILGQDGESKGVLKLGVEITHVEVGRGAAGPVCLGYTTWGDKVVAFSAVVGEVLWTRRTPVGVDGAHWGDLDADGVDEAIIGLNGSGGLLAVDSDGQDLWSYSSIGNVWSQAVIPASLEQPARVFATHAEGTVVELNSNGQFQRELPDLGYVAPMNATRMAPTGDIQLVVQVDVPSYVFLSSKVMLGLDLTGAEIWRLPVDKDADWQTSSFAHGDLNGDGADEWVVPGSNNSLVVMSQGGQRLGTVSLPSEIVTLTVTPEGNAHEIRQPQSEV